MLVKLSMRGALLSSIKAGQGPTVITVGAGGVFRHFSLIYLFSLLSPSLWETARYIYRLKYCLRESLNPKQPTNQSSASGFW